MRRAKKARGFVNPRFKPKAASKESTASAHHRQLDLSDIDAPDGPLPTEVWQHILTFIADFKSFNTAHVTCKFFHVLLVYLEPSFWRKMCEQRWPSLLILRKIHPQSTPKLNSCDWQKVFTTRQQRDSGFSVNSVVNVLQSFSKNADKIRLQAAYDSFNEFKNMNDNYPPCTFTSPSLSYALLPSVVHGPHGTKIFRTTEETGTPPENAILCFLRQGLVPNNILVRGLTEEWGDDESELFKSSCETCEIKGTIMALDGSILRWKFHNPFFLLQRNGPQSPYIDVNNHRLLLSENMQDNLNIAKAIKDIHADLGLTGTDVTLLDLCHFLIRMMVHEPDQRAMEEVFESVELCCGRTKPPGWGEEVDSDDDLPGLVLSDGEENEEHDDHCPLHHSHGPAHVHRHSHGRDRVGAEDAEEMLFRMALPGLLRHFTASGQNPINVNANNSRICRYFLEGRCRFGSQCYYSHDV